MRRNLSTQAIEKRAEALGVFTIFVRPHTAEENEALAVLLDRYEEADVKNRRAWPEAKRLLPKGMRLVARPLYYEDGELARARGVTSTPRGYYPGRHSRREDVHVLTDNRATGVRYEVARYHIERADPESMLIVPVHWDRASRKLAAGVPDTVTFAGGVSAKQQWPFAGGVSAKQQWQIVNGRGTRTYAMWPTKEAALDAALRIGLINERGDHFYVHGPDHLADRAP